MGLLSSMTGVLIKGKFGDRHAYQEKAMRCLVPPRPGRSLKLAGGLEQSLLAPVGWEWCSWPLDLGFLASGPAR